MSSATPSAVHRSPLHHRHVARGARFADRDGWQVPLAYIDPRDEVEAARNGVGLADVSSFAKLSLRGPGVPAVAATLGIIAPHGVAAIDGAIACFLTERCLFLLASVGHMAGWMERVSSSADVVRTDITSAYAGFAVVGKHAETLVRRLTSLDVASREFPEGACAETNLAGVHALLIRPPARSVPEIGVYVAWDVGEYVWDTMLRAGCDLGITSIGLEAMILLGGVQTM
jgi:sarcosine oxidase subunit alpha